MMTIDKDKIFTFFKNHPEKPWHLQELQKRLKLKQRASLKHVLSDLVNEGRLIRTRRRTYGLPQEMNLIVGHLQITSGGYGFVLSEKKDEKDLFIGADSLAGAWNGDRVVARPNPMRSDNGRISGEIVRVLQRKHDKVVGTLEYSRGYAILRPDSPKLRERILLLPDSVGTLAAGSRIVGELVWPEDSGEKDPFAAVVEVLGDGDNQDIETRAVIIKYNLKDIFEDETLNEAQEISLDINSEDLAGRTDLRDVNTFTIDGEDAKDFDDAISLERLKGKGKQTIRIGIHIADVSHYVLEGTQLDKEAKDRATSVYLPGRVLPMLPEHLSNGICSLLEGQARFALSVFVDLTKDAEIKSTQFKETIISSDARLTYEQVGEFADGGRLPRGKRKLERDIKLLLNVTQNLRKKRMGQGALDFNFSEARVDVDDQGALHLMPIHSNSARQLIEELMLLANRLVAKELSKRSIPTLYRVHEDPSQDRIQALQRALNKLGYRVDLEKASPQDLQAVLKEASGKPEAQLVNTLLLRSLKQARYSVENLGHFGLAFDHYLHFTSPIRRYPDLVVHRVLKAMLHKRLSPNLKKRLSGDFPALAEHTSERERNAESAERDLARYFHAKWAKDKIGESFQGVISGVTNFGIFVSLPNAVEGLIHVSQLDDDYYMYIEDSLMLLGKHKRRKFRLGDKLEIKILASNPVQRQIDLIPAYMDIPSIEADEKQESPKVKKQESPKVKKLRSGKQISKISKEKLGSDSANDVVSPPQIKPKRRVLVFGDPNLKK